VRFELQVLAGAKQRITVNLAAMLRLGPGSDEKLPREQL
jgi:hypothetical protein